MIYAYVYGHARKQPSQANELHMQTPTQNIMRTNVIRIFSSLICDVRLEFWQNFGQQKNAILTDALEKVPANGWPSCLVVNMRMDKHVCMAMRGRRGHAVKVTLNGAQRLCIASVLPERDRDGND